MNYKRALAYAIVPGEFFVWGIVLFSDNLSIQQYIGVALLSIVVVMLLAGAIESFYYM